jgi:hypothetical protein
LHRFCTIHQTHINLGAYPSRLFRFSPWLEHAVLFKSQQTSQMHTLHFFSSLWSLSSSEPLWSCWSLLCPEQNQIKRRQQSCNLFATN